MKQIQLTYHEESGYLYPDLTLPEQTHHPIGKYGDLYPSDFSKPSIASESVCKTPSGSVKAYACPSGRYLV